MQTSAITPATPGDIEQLSLLVNSAYRGESSKKGWTTEADILGGIRTDAAGLQKMMADPGAVVMKYTGEGNDALQGCVYLKQEGAKLYLGMLTVDPGLQAKGIGKKLLYAAEEYARQKGCNAITMTVISVRHELIAWYERHGYTKTGQTEPFPDDPAFGLPKQPLEFIVMEKKID